ncbi:MAG: esterase [Flavobacteriaceae bacterium]|nr:esterase [Flavobacteriaceae bacterium]
MNSEEKEIKFNIQSTYSTLNTLTANTKNIWFVCHGMGHLSRYFVKHFEALPSETNYIIAPQAPSKYYLNPKNKRVGASWLTKENTMAEMNNVISYFDAIFEKEQLQNNPNLIFLGYSQGVSVALRYAAKRKIQFKEMLLVAGGIPKELHKNDFDYLKSNPLVKFYYGNNDEYLNETRIKEESLKLNQLFPNSAIHEFEGTHEFHFSKILEISGVYK